ncbi:MAG: 4-(cytidine 5'-diphospho)-2-C-methyl-D-erythritol kinase [Planctomycetota bacterium]|nr:4-(cytidine 5'-diphospho)-2-C-methyl-D-erythritol kinase [Planctomycetota bacterium]
MSRYRLIEYGLEGDSGWALAPAKINLWLEVLERRDDGFHEVKTLLAPIAFWDRLEIKSGGDADCLTVEGIEVPTSAENLVMKALTRARQTRPIPHLQVHLVKKIPPKSGLGGGSSDAAAMLVLLDALFPAPGGRQELQRQAAAIGSDVPFFLGDGPAVATGRGEKIEAFCGPFLGGDRVFFNLVFPEIGLKTPEVYAALSEHLTSGASQCNFSVGSFQEKLVWMQCLHNRLLDGARRVEPRMKELAAILESLFPGSWSMTGSGSCFIVPAADEPRAVMAAEILRSRFHGVTTSAGRPGPPPVEIMTVPLLTPVE